MVDMVENIMEASRTVTRTADIVKDYEVPAGAVQQRAGPAPARGRKRPPPPPRPGLARPQGRGHHVDGGAGVRPPPASDLRVRRREGRRRGRAPARRLLVGHGHPGRTDPNDAAMAWSGSGTAKTACATGRATRPASPNRTEGEPLGTTDRSRWLPRPGGR